RRALPANVTAMAGNWTCERGHYWSASHARAGAEVFCPQCGGLAVEDGQDSSPTLQLRTRRSVLPTDETTPQPTSFIRPVHVPGYEILGELGRGGMGVVYQARQLVLDRLVALKMIHTGPGCDAAALARFRGEAEIIARLQHPNIIQVYEVGVC